MARVTVKILTLDGFVKTPFAAIMSLKILGKISFLP
jgi:hypothetical protein